MSIVQHDTHEEQDTAPTKAPWSYRARRMHLFPLEEFRWARTVGAEVRAYCGVVEFIKPKGDPSKIKGRSVHDPLEVDDCHTCLDVWHRSSVVRL